MTTILLKPSASNNSQNQPKSIYELYCGAKRIDFRFGKLTKKGIELAEKWVNTAIVSDHLLLDIHLPSERVNLTDEIEENPESELARQYQKQFILQFAYGFAKFTADNLFNLDTAKMKLPQLAGTLCFVAKHVPVNLSPHPTTIANSDSIAKEIVALIVSLDKKYGCDNFPNDVLLNLSAAMRHARFGLYPKNRDDGHACSEKILGVLCRRTGLITRQRQ